MDRQHVSRLWHWFPWILGLTLLCSLPAPSLADTCLPAEIANRDALYYFAREEQSIAGVVYRSDDDDLRICRFAGEWSRIRLDFDYYWIKTGDLRISPEVKEVVALGLPSSKHYDSTEEQCREAMVSAPFTVLFHGQDGRADSAVKLDRGTLLLVCSEEAGWAEVQYRETAGFVEVSQLRISTSVRPRGVGFETRKVCRKFVWSGRTLRKTPMLRRTPGGKVVQVHMIPEQMLVSVSDAEEDWYWVNSWGDWGYVRKSHLELMPSVETTTAHYAPTTQCVESYRVGLAKGANLPLLTAPGGSTSSIVIPEGSQYVFWPQSSAARTDSAASKKRWWKAQYLGKTGWVPTDRIVSRSRGRPMWVDYEPQPADETLFVTGGLAGRRSDGSRWSFRAAMGPMYSDSMELTGVGLEAGAFLKVRRFLELYGGVLSANSSGPLVAGPEIGLDFIPYAHPDGGFALRLGGRIGCYWFGGTGRGLLFGGSVNAGVTSGLSDIFAMGLGYSLHLFRTLMCPEGSCPGGPVALLHGFGLTLDVHL